jgi:nicotinamidase-related amidase
MQHEEQIGRRYARLPEPDLAARNSTALLVIDMQYGDAHRDFGTLRRMADRGDAAAVDYYASRLESLVVPNIQRLQAAFRAVGSEVIHTRIQSLTRDGRDRSLQHRSLGIHHPPGSKEAEFLPEVAPQGDEIVLNKTCGGAFNGTNLDYVLRNLDIRTLVISGVVTSGCVELAVRDASDRGFAVVVVEDATATWSPEMQSAAMRAMREIYAKVVSADEVVARVANATAVRVPVAV